MLVLPTTEATDEVLLGQMRLNAHFDGGVVTGRADSFAVYDAQFTNVARFEDAFDKREDLSGQLDVANGETVSIPVGAVEGQVIRGEMVGALDGPSGSYQVDVDLFGGVSVSNETDALVVTGELGRGSVVGTGTSVTYGTESGIAGAILLSSE